MSKRNRTETDATDVQGEGDYRAARRYVRGVKRYIATHDVEAAARRAAPHSADEAEELQVAEAAGRARDRSDGADAYARGARCRIRP